MQTHTLPIWNGEFGPVYASPLTNPHTTPAEALETNAQRTSLLRTQLQIYSTHKISWSIWLYKDIGVQGLVSPRPTSPYISLVKSFLAKKREWKIDDWNSFPSEPIDALIQNLCGYIDENIPRAKETYPGPWNTRRHVMRLVMQMFVAGACSSEFAELFRGCGREELGELAGSWRFEECEIREGLVGVLREFA
jgi:hypothetical protein